MTVCFRDTVFNFYKCPNSAKNEKRRLLHKYHSVHRESKYNIDSGTMKYKERVVMVRFERDFDRDIQHRKGYKNSKSPKTVKRDETAIEKQI